MRKLLNTTILLFGFLVLCSCLCHKPRMENHVPTCIQNEITGHQNNPNSTVGEVKEYEFQGKIVYGFDNNMMADGTMEIKDGSCNTICHVGGFGGPNISMCNGENFFQNAVLKRTVWKR